MERDHEAGCPRLQFWDAGEHEAPCLCTIEHEKGPCETCEAAVIDGVFTHEINCSNHWKGMDGKAYPRGCFQCGSLFIPIRADQRCCCGDCSEEYAGGA